MRAFKPVRYCSQLPEFVALFVNKFTGNGCFNIVSLLPCVSSPVLSNIEPPAPRRKAATDKLVEKIVKHDSWPIQPDILSPPLL